MSSFVSIVVPVKNSEVYIQKTLESLSAQDYPKDSFEIILVDHGSTDHTLEIVKKYDVNVLAKKGGNISSVRNFGAQVAKGGILAFIDSDCIAPTHWLREAVRILSDPQIAAVGNWYALPNNPSWVERVWDAHTGRKIKVSGEVKWLPSSNFIIRKNIFEKINGFDESKITGEDFEICQKVISCGEKIYADEKLTVVHLGNPKNLIQFFKKEYWRGKGGLQLLLNKFSQHVLDKTVLFAFSLIILFSLMGYGLLSGKNALSATAIILILMEALSLSLFSIGKNKKYPYFLSLAFLFLVYGFARALALLDLEVWRNYLFKKSNTAGR